jgi:EmrB/QacA subfamily drug resistance transporter
MNKTRPKNLKKITASLIAGLFLAGIDMSVVNVMLPVLSKSFQVSIDAAAVIITVYVGIMAATQLFFGRCSDIFEAEGLFFTGILIFTFSSFLCAISFEFHWLILSRILQGLGGAMAAAASGAVILRNYPHEKIGSTIGLMMMAVGIGNACGPPLGGIMLMHFSWHWIFAAQVPIGILSCVLIGFKGFKKINSDKNVQKGFDLKGTFLSMALLVFFLGFLFKLSALDIKNFYTFVLMSGFILSGFAFYMHEKKYPYPLVRFSVFKEKIFKNAFFLKLFILMIMQGWVIIFPFFMVKVWNLETDKVGAVLMILSAVMFAATPVAGKLSDRAVEWKVMNFGFFLVICALLSSFMLKNEPSFFVLIPLMAFFGLGMSSFLVASSSIILKSAPKGEEGMFSGFNTLLMPIGSAIGSTLFSGLYMTGTNYGGQFFGFRTAVSGMSCIGLIIFIILFFKTKNK